MKNIQIPITLIILIILFPTSGIGCSCSGYQSITIEELISDTAAYDGMNVLITGTYNNAALAEPQCIPIGTGENPEIRDEYALYRSSVRITGLYESVGIEFIDMILEDRRVDEINYEYGQEVTFRGIVRATTVQQQCNRDVRYRSYYIEVKAKDMDVTWIPTNPPQTKPDDS